MCRKETNLLKSAVLGLLRAVSVLFDDVIVSLNFLIVKGSQFYVIIR